MKWKTVSIYIGFYIMIGLAVYWTKSGWPLWALIFLPCIGEGTK